MSAGEVATVELTPFKWGEEGNRPMHPQQGFDPNEPEMFMNGER